MKNEPATERWFEDLPPTWSTVRLGSLGTFAKGRGGSKEDNRESGVPVVRYGDLYTKFGIKITQPAAFVSDEDSLKYTPLPTNTLVFSASGEDAAEIGKAAVSLLDEPAVVGGDTVLFTPARDRDPVYLAYALESHPSRAQKTVRATGFTVVHISAGRLKTISLPIPSFAEQRAIADFLDRETALIDTLIEKQHTLIERLRERRREAVSHAVRLGLDSGAAMAEGQVPWIAKFPAHWTTPQLRRIVKASSGAGFPVEEQGLSDEAYPFYKVNALGRADHDGVIRERYDTISRATAESLRASIIPAGSLVLAKIGAALLLGRIRVLAHDSCIDNNMLALSPRPGAQTRFLYYALQDVRMDLLVNPGAVPSLSEKWFRAYQIPLPPHSEQIEIADHLDRETAKIDALIKNVERHIELARERRSALITAAVTGQIEVGA